MSIDQAYLKDLEASIADQLYIQIANWHLYLGDAGVAKSLAIECLVRLEDGPELAVEKALASVQVSIAGGKSQLSLGELIPSSQVHDLIDLIAPFSR